MRPSVFVRLVAAGAVVFAALVAASSVGAAGRNGYVVTSLVTDQSDAGLVNPWGLAASATSPWWVADNHSNLSTLYDGAGSKLALTVVVDGGPTGIVFNIANTTGAFPVAAGAALFIFASEDGRIRGWRPPPAATAQIEASSPGAVYKGLAIASTAAGPRLFATDFHDGRIDVFDAAWQPVPNAGFVDSKIPAGYGPFGIQTIGNRVFVTYARQDAEATDELHGQGLGFVDVYDTGGTLLGRVAQHGQLNAPWGIALAPASFGRFAGDLLVGNFGDGEINAYAELGNGHFAHRGELRGQDRKPLAIDGLWALEFGNDHAAGPSGRLFFTAGPNDENNGLFGSIDPA